MPIIINMSQPKPLHDSAIVAISVRMKTLFDSVYCSRRDVLILFVRAYCGYLIFILLNS